MSDEPKKGRSRRRRRRRPASNAAASGGDTNAGRKPRSSGKRRARGRGRSSTGGRKPRRERRDQKWWAKRWSKSLDSIHVGRRVGHGRKYARQGRVMELEFDKGSATAMVQGSRDAPYLVRMHFTMLPTADWRKILKSLGEDIELGAGLFRGEFPERTEEAFTLLELPLFFSGEGDLKAACSCPDPANPCKHVAAVYYALGEEISRDPFLLFRLRGLDRTELMESLARTPAARAALAPPTADLDARARADANKSPSGKHDSLEESTPAPPADEPLSEDPIIFWAGQGVPPDEEDHKAVRVPQISGAIAQRLGGFPFWRGDGSSSLILDQLYRRASQAGLLLYLGEPDPDSSNGGKS